MRYEKDLHILYMLVGKIQKTDCQADYETSNHRCRDISEPFNAKEVLT